MLEGMAPDPETLSEDELYELASKLKIRGRRKMARDKLVAAVKKALAEKAPSEPEEPKEQPRAEERDAFGDEVEERFRAPEVLTIEEHQKIRRASTESLQKLVADEETEIKKPVRVAIDAEIARRQGIERERARQEALRSPLDRFVVTKGGRYVTRGGHLSDLREGQMLTRGSYDLKHVQGQGIEFAPCLEVEVGEDQLGTPVSRAVPLKETAEKHLEE